MTNSRKDRSFDRLPDSDSVVRICPANVMVSISSGTSLFSNLNVFSVDLIGSRVPTGMRDMLFPERCSVSTVAPWNVPLRSALSLLSCNCSFVRFSPAKAECGNSSMLLPCMSRWLRFVRPRNAPGSIVSILLLFSDSVSSAGRFSNAPAPSLRSSPLPISSVRKTGSDGNVCVADISTTLLPRNIILTTLCGKLNGISVSSPCSQLTVISPIIARHSH